MLKENSNVFKILRQPYLVASYFKDIKFRTIPELVSNGVVVNHPENVRTNIDFNVVPRIFPKTNNRKIYDLYNRAYFQDLGLALPYIMAEIQFDIINSGTGEVLKKGTRHIIMKEDTPYLYSTARDVYMSRYESIEYLTVSTELHGSKCNNALELQVKDITFYSLSIGDEFDFNQLATNIHSNCIGKNLFLVSDDSEWDNALFLFTDDNKHINLNKNGIYNSPQYISTNKMFSRRYNISTAIQHNHKIRFKISLSLNDLIILNDTQILAGILNNK